MEEREQRKLESEGSLSLWGLGRGVGAGVGEGLSPSYSMVTAFSASSDVCSFLFFSFVEALAEWWSNWDVYLREGRGLSGRGL